MSAPRADDRAAGSNQGLDLRVDPAEFFMVARAARDADKRLYAAMRSEMRSEASELVGLIRAEIGRIPSSGSGRTGIRTALQRGTRASISVASARTAGVRIVTSAKFLPPRKRTLAKAMNLERFRHPVFSVPEDEPRVWRNNRTRRAKAHAASIGADYRTLTSWKWVEQHGRPYFGAVIYSEQTQVLSRLQTALIRTIDQTATEIARTKGRAL